MKLVWLSHYVKYVNLCTDSEPAKGVYLESYLRILDILQKSLIVHFHVFRHQFHLPN